MPNATNTVTTPPWLAEMMFTDNQKKLLQLLGDGHFHSGTHLAQILHISRSAVWKHLQSFAELGIEVHAINGKGYRLSRPITLLSANAITSRLDSPTKHLIAKLEIFDQLDSTNTYLMNHARKSNASGHICLAEYQSSGKGRRGRTWVSPFAGNIYLSILWRFQLGLSALGGLSLVVGVAVVRALKKLGISGVGLKWPNDIYWQDKKLGGILIEVIGESEGPCSAVIGLGLNVYLPLNTTASIQQPWIDLEQILGEIPIDRNQLTATLLNELIPILELFSTENLPSYLEEWRSYDCMLNKAVTFHLPKQTLKGVVKGINQDGLLLLTTEQGEIRTFASGELSFSPFSHETIA